MAIPHANTGEIIDVRPLGLMLSNTKTTTLVKTDAFEVIRLVIPAGKEIPTHKAPGEISVQCLEGRVEFTTNGKTQELSAGQLLYLSAAQPHALKGIQDASLLVTLLLSKGGLRQQVDIVQEASEESFPASDPPARTPIVSP